MMGMGEKPRNIQKDETKEKKFPVCLPPVYEMEADCFPVSETPKKSEPTLSGRGFLI